MSAASLSGFGTARPKENKKAELPPFDGRICFSG
jgi:hypothetical protein